MANRPRLHCPKCGSAMRRVYLQNPAGSPGTRFPTVEGWLYCLECKQMRRASEARPT